jgi:predicted ATPase/DNA-binding CsgD family transcriptional regulator
MNRAKSEIITHSVPYTNLPTVLSSFVGRERETGEITRLLTSSRLLTLTGAAGCGKTRLALRAAEEISRQYPDGVHWVALARLSDSALVPQLVAKSLHVAEQSGLPIIEGLSNALRDKHLLLVLDNCEHVLPACSQLVEHLLAATSTTILATSREPLNVMGEMLYPVTPLTLPPESLSVEDIAQFDAIRLFVERARATVPAFELTVDNAGAVASICRKLDGVPLAIELASARVNVLTVEQIAARLDDRFRLLTAASHVTYSQHDTLRAALDWSHNLLTVPEQTLLQRLSVFPGGCSLPAIETVCTGDSVEHERVIDLLSSLVSKSLIVADTLQRGEARYWMLETIRQYGQAKLITSGEWSALQDRHLEYVLHVTEETEPKLRGQYQQLWLDWLENEFASIRAALAWSLESRNIEVGLRIVIALYQFWTIRDYAEEGLAWSERLLAEANESVSLAVRANTLSYATNLAGFRGNTAAIERYRRSAILIAEKAGDKDRSALIWALNAQYFAAHTEGDHQTEFTLAKRIIQLQREAGDAYLLAIALSTGSFTAMSLGKYNEARQLLDEGLPLLREMGNPYRIAMALNFSGDLARCEGNYAQAQAAYEESIALLREINAVRDLASVSHNLGHVCLRLDDIRRARDLFDQCMATHQAQGNAPGMAECLIGFAGLSIVCGLPAAGARLLGALVAIGGERIATAWAATKLEYEHYLALARAGLTEAEFEAEQAAGRTFTLERAVAYARDVAQSAIAAQKASQQPDALTLREREVVALIARAKSNDEIATELVVSKRTVEKHIANIRSKLGFSKRAEIVRWALENQPHR